MAELTPVLQKQFLVSVAGISAVFIKVSGISEERETVNYNDGETGLIKKHLGFTSFGDVTLGKVFYPVSDKALVTWFQAQRKTPTPFTVTLQPVNADLEGTPIAGAATILLQNCKVSKMKWPDVDRDGSGMAMLELTVLPLAIVYQ